jgi:hypothetical protein
MGIGFARAQMSAPHQNRPKSLASNLVGFVFNCGRKQCECGNRGVKLDIIFGKDRETP